MPFASFLHTLFFILQLLLRKKSNMFVFFYDDDEIFSRKILRGLEKLDDELQAAQSSKYSTIEIQTPIS